MNRDRSKIVIFSVCRVLFDVIQVYFLINGARHGITTDLEGALESGNGKQCQVLLLLCIPEQYKYSYNFTAEENFRCSDEKDVTTAINDLVNKLCLISFQS
jgi:hypothetical protein